MRLLLKKQTLNPNKSVFRWFIICFSIVSIIFCLVLFPLIKYCQNVFTKLALEKSSQQLHYGITQIENTVKSINSASVTLLNDPRFVPLRYLTPDSSSINITVRKQMSDYLHGLIFPLTLVSDCALLISEDEVVTPYHSYFDSIFRYYPEHFCIDNLTYKEWRKELTDNKTGFLPVHHVTTNITSYHALIYSIPWTRSAYIYACIDIEALKKAFIAESDSDNYYLAVSTTEGNLLYSDLPDSEHQYHTITKNTSLGNLTITIYIPDSTFTNMMRPLYTFLELYGVICFMILSITILLGSHFSSKPLHKILHILEHNNKFKGKTSVSEDNIQPRSLLYGFHFIQDKLKQVEQDLEQYQTAFSTQQMILQARYFEKALNGQMDTAKDTELFHFYLPEFPDEYCLISLKMTENAFENGIIYPEPFYLLQTLLKSALPGVLQQQMNDTELLLVIPKSKYESCIQTLNFVINNINHKEPCYRIHCIASKFYAHLESLPIAYRELQLLDDIYFPDSMSQVCIFEDYTEAPLPVHIADIFTLYTSITYGNIDVAQQKFQIYSKNPAKSKRHVYELIYTILVCIKMEHPEQLMEIDIPQYSTQKDNWPALEQTIYAFCNAIQNEAQAEPKSFSNQLLNYINKHYTEYELCVTTLEEVFQCSASKIRKTFKKSMGITINDYIERKRMDLANELLAQNEKNLTEIALKCGFANANSFYKAYRRIYGHSPATCKPESAKIPK